MKNLTFIFVLLFVCLAAACGTTKVANEPKSLGTTQIGKAPFTLSETLVKQILDPANKGKFTESYPNYFDGMTAKFSYKGKKYTVDIMDNKDKIVINTTDYDGEYVVTDDGLDDIADAGWYRHTTAKYEPIPSMIANNLIGLTDKEKDKLKAESPWRTKLYMASIEVSEYLSDANKSS